MEWLAVVRCSPWAVLFVVCGDGGDGSVVLCKCVVVTDSFNCVGEVVGARDDSAVLRDAFVVDALVGDDGCVRVCEAVDAVGVIMVVVGDNDDVGVVGGEWLVVWVVLVVASGCGWPVA